MGSFSWNRADDLTNIENVAAGTTFKFLIPAEFGGGFIKEKYQDYGFLGRKSDNSHKYDMYELLAQWNAPDLVIGCIHGTLKEVDENTEHNRSIGIDIGCYDDQIDKLKYPLKLVSPRCTLSYEDCEKPSYGDPDQGFFSRKRNSSERYKWMK